MSQFDPAKALREEIISLGEVKTVLRNQERDLERKFIEMEITLNSMKKLRGFADAELDRKREVLKQLEAQG